MLAAHRDLVTRMATFTQTGGARVGNFNASFPLATLSADSEALHLSCLGREYHFPRSSIRRLCRQRGLFSVGLRIEHAQDSLPEFIVFWASMFSWTSGFQKLRTQLESLGYDVTA
jgi:hypothetical protein